MTDVPLLSLRQVVKSFGAVQAVLDGSVDLYARGRGRSAAFKLTRLV